jgi:hypothetical protein
VGAEIEKKMHIIFFIYIFLFGGKKRGASALNIFSIFYTHHRIPNKLEKTTLAESSCPSVRIKRIVHSQKSWVILLMNIHKPNRVIYDVSK